MYRYFFYSILITCLTSCSNVGNHGKSDKQLLISSTGQFIMEDGEHTDDYFKNRDKFIKPYTSMKISGDTIIATTLHDVNACMEYTGDVLLSNDTLYLSVATVGDESCASTSFVKLTYYIRKPAGKNPVIRF